MPPEILRAWYTVGSSDLRGISHLVMAESHAVLDLFSLAMKAAKAPEANRIIDFRIHRSSEHVGRLVVGTNSPDDFKEIGAAFEGVNITSMPLTKSLEALIS